MHSLSVRRSALPALSRTYPVLIGQAEGPLVSPVVSPVAPRIRDALVLRLVAGRKAALLGLPDHAHGLR